MIARAAVAVALITATTARADPAGPGAAPRTAAANSDSPDRAVVEAGDANLESVDDRRGVTFSASVGGGLIIGFGIDDSVGRGGSVSLRLGHVATRSTVITFELAVTAVLHKQGMSGPTETNTDTNLLAGALHYVNKSLWLRFGGGLGVYQGRKVVLPNGQPGDLTLVGPAALAGVGLDLVRFKYAVLGLEFGTSAMVNREGLLLASATHLGLTF
ncbi:MAG TPA: hypothetical protein VFT22_03805 [Kofleriaceae bacterium]|nr:hypothetical protein [Kofleriaceae bacterium]